MKVLRVLNNNVVLSTRPDGTEVVLTGWGVGFKMKPGQLVDETKVTQVFVPENSRDVDNMAQLLAAIDPDYLELVGTLLAKHKDAFGEEFGSATVVALADHLQVAVKRNGIDPDLSAQPNPLEAEVRNLYPEEYRIAAEMLGVTNSWLVRRDTPPLPDSEATAIALHLVNAGFRTEDLAETYKMTGLFSQLFDVIDSALGITIDRHSVNAARFITHMRYFFVRVNRHKQFDEGMSVLRSSLEISHPEAVMCAHRLKSVLELRLETELLDDEVAYLALHVARLASEVER